MKTAGETTEIGPTSAYGVAALALVAGVAGASASCAPVGSAIPDGLCTAAFAALVTAAGAAGSPFALALGGIVLAAFGGTAVLHAVGLIIVLGAAGLDRRSRRAPVPGAAVTMIIVQASLRLPTSGPARTSSAIAALAVTPIILSALRASSSRMRRRVRGAVMVAALIVVTGAALGAYAAIRTRGLVLDAERHARNGVDAARGGDRMRAADEFDVARHDFDESASTTGSWLTWPAREIPLLAPQLRTLDRVANVGARALARASSAARRVDPDELRLVDGRVDLTAIAAYQPTFDDVAATARAAAASLESMPKVWLVAPLGDAVARFEHTMRKAADSATTADDAIRLAPSLLGRDTTRTYLVLFVTPAEARASGGFIANYGVLTATDGRLHLDRIGRVRALDEAGARQKRLAGPPDYVARYTKFDVANTWENVTMSPDFPSVAAAAAELFPQSGGVPIDGVIRVDPVAISHLLAITGPVHLRGIDHAIDTRNVVPFLLRDQYALRITNDERVNLLGDIARAVFDRLTHGRSATPSGFAHEMSPAVQGTNLALWFANAEAQVFARRIGADASVAPPQGDSLGVVTQNAGASKIDVYLRRAIAYAATIDPNTGAVTATATIRLRNDAPSRGLADYVIGNSVGAPPGTNRSYVSVYSPLALIDATVDGQRTDLDREHELGRNVYSEFVDIPPGATRMLTLRLSGAVDLSRHAYDFGYFGQVLANPDDVSLDAHVRGGARFGHGGRDVRVSRANVSVAWSTSIAMRR